MEARAQQVALGSDLEAWWMKQTTEEIMHTIPKAIEYGSNSMVEVGHGIARVAGREISDEEATELAVLFYIKGKVGRWMDAVVAGQRPSDDTLFDIGVYARMAQRNREKGMWP